jgi:short-subunit dehydrogenase
MKQTRQARLWPAALLTGAPSGIGEEFARPAAAGINVVLYMATTATKAYVLNLGEALHVELRQAGVNVTDLVPLLVPLAEVL